VMTHFVRECWRVRWMIVLVVGVVALRSLGVLYPTWPGTVVANKPVGACLGGIIGLVYVQQAFPYENHSAMLSAAMDTNRSLQERRLMVWLYTGLAVKRGLIIAAFVVAVAGAF
jgi:hypothetical protein